MRRSSVQIRPVALLVVATLRRTPEAAAHAGVAQLVERNLAKVEVAGSNPVTRSFRRRLAARRRARPPAKRGDLLSTLGAWLSPVERCVRDAEVPGSNPGAPIPLAQSCWLGGLFRPPGLPRSPPGLRGPPKAVVAKSGRLGPVNMRQLHAPPSAAPAATDPPAARKRSRRNTLRAPVGSGAGVLAPIFVSYVYSGPMLPYPWPRRRNREARVSPETPVREEQRPTREGAEYRFMIDPLTAC